MVTDSAFSLCYAIRRFWSSNRWNLTCLLQLLHVTRKVSGSSHLSKTMAERTQNTLVYNICVSQGSVATRLRCCGNINNSFIAHYLQSVPVKELFKSVNIWQRYGQMFSNTFLWTTMYNCTYCNLNNSNDGQYVGSKAGVPNQGSMDPYGVHDHFSGGPRQNLNLKKNWTIFTILSIVQYP